MQEWFNPNTLPNWAIFLVTATYVAVAVGQLVAIRRQANIAAQSNRPFLLITRVRFIGEFVESEPKKPTVSLVRDFAATLQNYGAGPADIIDYIIDWRFFNPPPPDPTINFNPDEGNRLNDSVIAPGTRADDRLVVTITITEELRKTLNQETKRIGIYGRVRYRGAHQQVYETRFFWWHFAENNSFARALDPELNSHT